MNLVRDLPPSLPRLFGNAFLTLDERAEGVVIGSGLLDIGFRPEALRVGDGPLRARIRTVEDLGSEVFVHVALEFRGEQLALVSKMPAPFAGRPGESVGLQIVGDVHVFHSDSGLRLTSATGTLAAQ